MLLHQGKTGRQRDFLQTLFCTTEREEELLTSIMAILGFLVVLATAAVLARDGVTHFFLTTVTKSQSKGLSPDTMDHSGSEILAGAVTTVTSGLPPTAHTTSYMI
jgi:hypothetical protein